MSEWNFNFKAGTELIECCPGCACEIMVDGDGTTECPECGWKNVLPCTACCDANGMQCDWDPITICTPYRRNK